MPPISKAKVEYLSRPGVKIFGLDSLRHSKSLEFVKTAALLKVTAVEKSPAQVNRRPASGLWVLGFGSGGASVCLLPISIGDKEPWVAKTTLRECSIPASSFTKTMSRNPRQGPAEGPSEEQSCQSTATP